jgi:hypothetical protein
MFQPYRGYAYSLRHLLPRLIGEKVTRENLQGYMSEMIKKFLRLRPGENVAKQDVMAVLTELCHYLLSHKVYYVKTTFAEQLMNSSIELNIENLHIPHRIFEVCFEESLELVPGYKAASCLVALDLTAVEHGAMQEFLSQSVGMPVDFSVPLKSLAVRFAPISELELGAMIHVVIDLDSEKGKPIDDVIQSLEPFRYSGEMVALAPIEKEAEKKICRIVLGMLCYLNTKDPDVGEFKNRNRPAFGSLRPTEFLLGASFTRDIAWHLRKAHWRFLKHERYKRDEAGSARCVWVRSAEINRGADPSAPARKIELAPKDDLEVTRKES